MKIGSMSPEARAAYTPPPPTAPTNQAIQKEPGVRGSFGSTSGVRGIVEAPKYNIRKVDPSPAMTYEPSEGYLHAKVAKGANGTVSIAVKLPEPSFPLTRLKEELRA